MAKDKVWAVGEVMRCGSDDDKVMPERQNPERDTTKAFIRVHENTFGRNSQFGWGRKHEAKVVKADSESVHMVCACGAVWDFPQTSDQDSIFEKHHLIGFDLLNVKKESPEFLPSVSQSLFKK